MNSNQIFLTSKGVYLISIKRQNDFHTATVPPLSGALDEQHSRIRPRYVPPARPGGHRLGA
ncbi:hypothetical protein BCEP4_710026 [Burkholderia cepacia]|nr:hypothetical protein BCEP4_710026 [Burkholderia cepacia]